MLSNKPEGMVKMSFNEKQFRQLADETRKTVVALGTTAECVLKRHEKVTEMSPRSTLKRRCYQFRSKTWVMAVR